MTNPPLSVFAAQKWGFQTTACCICGSETQLGLTQLSYSCAKGTRGGFEPQSCDRKTQPGGRKTQLGLNKLDWVVRIIELRSRKTRLGGPKIWRASRKNSIGTAKTRLGGAENGLACPENSIGWPGKVSGARRKRTSVMREPGFQRTGFAERPKMRGGGLSLASDKPPPLRFCRAEVGFPGHSVLHLRF